MHKPENRHMGNSLLAIFLRQFINIEILIASFLPRQTLAYVMDQLIYTTIPPDQSDRLLHYTQGLEYLVEVIQKLSLAKDLDTVMQIVRVAARKLTGADGATFVLREGDKCYYAEEDAIEPLWKGQRFPMSTCISGWVIENAKIAVIPDIYADSRIPQDAYKPTFVKSLVVVPIRTENPIGAIGNYWANPHAPTSEEIQLIQALANTTTVAIENIQLYNELEQRIKERTTQLESVNKELEAFAYSVSHDLRAPLRGIDGFSSLLLARVKEKLEKDELHYLFNIRENSQRMGELIDDLIKLSRLNQVGINPENVNLSHIAKDILTNLKAQEPDRNVEIQIQEDVTAVGDQRLLRVALENLFGNAWKYTSKKENTLIEFGVKQEGGRSTYYVQDNGAGFDMKYAGKLFGAFQRLHREDEFPGTGIGLATVARIIHQHNGQIWAESQVDQGATFCFNLKA